MLYSDWLSHCALPAIGVRWLDVVHKISTLFRLSEIFKEVLETNEKLDS